MTIAGRAFSLDCAGPLAFEGRIGRFTLPAVGFREKVVRLGESGVSLSGGVELLDGVVELVLFK